MEKIKKIPHRSEADPKYTWATEDIYVSDEAWRADTEKLTPMLEKIASYEGRLGEGANVMLDFFRLYEDIISLVGNIGDYACRKKDEDTKNSTYQAMYSQAMSLYVKTNSSVSFLESELLGIEDAVLDKFFEEEAALLTYKRAIMESRRRKDHILSPEMEKLLASAGEIARTPGSIYSLFNNADLTFPSVKDSNGKEYEVTHGSFIPLMESADETLRKNAFEALYGSYGNFKNTAAEVLSSQIKQLHFFANARKYNSTLEAALDVTNVPTEVYHNLIKTIHDNMHYLHKYVSLRKKLLKKEELHMYDLYTPIVPDVAVEVPFEEAKQHVLDGVAPLGKEYQSYIKEGFDNRWIDVYENIGKRSGAYCAGVQVHPFVLLNYKGTLDNEFTLAHEMGHAIHSYLSNRTQPIIDADYVIFVAEVASTCNEALLMQHKLQNTNDKMQRAYLINHFLDQFKGTIYRQTMFAEFELKINEMHANGEPITADALCKLYHQLNKEYYGEDIIVDEDIAMEWARIPHFYYNYYVFQYATGFSAAIALSQKILKEGEPAVTDYLNFLSGGCSKDPISLLRGAGVDMASPEPINEALKLFGSFIDELDELLSE